MIQVVDASFITSAVSLRDSAHEGIVEVAFLGRSNVGKSSLINALTNHKNLAKSSSTPGKTKLINFFEVIYSLDKEKQKVHFVDLPGFGYAKVSKSEKKVWKKNLTDFLNNRLSLRLFLLLVDARHPNMQIDKDVDEYIQSIQGGDQKCFRVFTKVDKLNQKELFHLTKAYPNALLVSTTKKRGIQKLNEIIFTTLTGKTDDIR